jgi:translation initiation factor 4G
MRLGYGVCCGTEADRGKERMMEILDDRSLSFLQPMLRVEMELGKQIRSDQSPAALIKWLKDNVGPKIMASPVFVDLAFTE